MNLDIKNLPDNPDQLKEIIISLNADFQKKILSLEEMIRFLRNEIFGRKSEKRPVQSQPFQFPLFNEAESFAQDPEKTLEPDPSIPVASHERKKTGRKPLPQALPRIEVIHDIDESQKQCACGCQLTRIGQEVCEKLDIIPAKMQVIRHIRYKYACKGCEGVHSDGPTVLIAAAPVQLIPKSIATPGLLAHIMTAKFEDAVPFCRQTKQFDRIGIELSRVTLSNMTVQAAQKALLLVELMIQSIREGPIVNIVSVKLTPSSQGSEIVRFFRGSQERICNHRRSHGFIELSGPTYRAKTPALARAHCPLATKWA